jgi:hypothetical protein
MRYKKYLPVGPGGRKCVCCFPAPRSKERRRVIRIAKRKEKLETMKNLFTCD